MVSRILIALSVTFFAFFFLACSGTTTPSGQRTSAQTKAKEAEKKAIEAREGTSIDARVMAEEFVKQHLKFPDDASFEWGKEVGQTKPIKGKSHWIVKGKVKATNAFGAKLTYRYTVQLYVMGPGKWKARAVILNDEQVYYNENVVYLDVPPESSAEPEPERESKPEAESVVNTIPQPGPESEPPRAQAQAYRKWSSGDHSTEARLITLVDGIAFLKKPDGEMIKVPYDKLSPTDQQFLDDWRKRK